MFVLATVPNPSISLSSIINNFESSVRQNLCMQIPTMPRLVNANVYWSDSIT